METKDAIAGIQAVNEMLGLFKESGEKLDKILPMFNKAVQGDNISWITGIAAIGELSQDDAQGCLIVALSSLCQVLNDLPPEQGAELLQSLRGNKRI